MTPFEKLGYKVGDKFEVIGVTISRSVKPGDVVTMYRDDGTDCPVFHLEDGDIACLFPKEIRPLKTEAQTRNAKLGEGITFKPTGAKGVFWKSTRSIFGEEWSVLMDNGNILTTTPSQIRLDHEPEYKEIPFSEATHEQRMDVSALRFDGGPVEQIFQFDNGEYMFTISACKAVANAWNILKVRIPT